MPTIKTKEIREMDLSKRTGRLDELNTELSRMKASVKAGGTVENPARIKQLRRSIAMILTIQREEEQRRSTG